MPQTSHLQFTADLQAPARKKDLKVSKDAPPSKPVAEVPASPAPAKAKSGAPDDFALVTVVAVLSHLDKQQHLLKHSMLSVKLLCAANKRSVQAGQSAAAC